MKKYPTTESKVKDFKEQIENWMQAYNDNKEDFPEEAEIFLRYAQKTEVKLKRFLEIKDELKKF